MMICLQLTGLSQKVITFLCHAVKMDNAYICSKPYTSNVLVRPYSTNNENWKSRKKDVLDNDKLCN